MSHADVVEVIKGVFIGGDDACDDLAEVARSIGKSIPHTKGYVLTSARNYARFLGVFFVNFDGLITVLEV